MDYLSNYHSHTVFCDGKNTPEEMVQEACRKKFKAFGFSAHAMHPYASETHLDVEQYAAYVAEINRLKKIYPIELFVGFEVEYAPCISEPDVSAYKKLGAEYIIGSVHFVTGPYKKKMFAVDDTPQVLKDGIENCFGGNVRMFVECYFETLREMVKTCTFDFVGHPDLIRKYNASLHLFDEEEKWYKQEVEKTVCVFAEKKVVTEINTGAIARKVMDDVYPSSFFLKSLCKAGVPVVISADAHSSQMIDCAFERAETCARTAGYAESMQLVRAVDGSLKWCAMPF